MTRSFIFLACTISCLFALHTTANAADDLQVGAAFVNITPPVPYRMCGYFNERFSEGTNDPLHAKAIVLKQGDQSIALVFCDLMGISLT